MTGVQTCALPILPLAKTLLQTGAFAETLQKFMKKHIYSLLLMILLGYSVGAQDNFSVDLDEVPTFLNVCGDPDRETVIVSEIGRASCRERV